MNISNPDVAAARESQASAGRGFAMCGVVVILKFPDERLRLRRRRFGAQKTIIQGGTVRRAPEPVCTLPLVEGGLSGCRTLLGRQRRTGLPLPLNLIALHCQVIIALHLVQLNGIALNTGVPVAQALLELFGSRRGQRAEKSFDG